MMRTIRTTRTEAVETRSVFQTGVLHSLSSAWRLPSLGACFLLKRSLKR